ncbi:MAG: hypothetical protein QOG41_2024 [Thermoleophilaceae bacterium]|jgi:hypothetical protein|nr:hypothetical protein [Thermoleophilaceae bacterium]
MPHAGLELHDGERGLRLLFRETAAESGGLRLAMEWTVDPGRQTVGRPHVHAQGGSESFELLEGEAGYRVGKDEHRERAPHSWPIPPDTAHVHPWNVGQEQLRFMQTIVTDDPANGLTDGVGRYFETIFALSAQGKVDARGDITDFLQSAVTIRELLMPGSWLPTIPRPAQRALFGGLAALARARGRQAYVAAT